MLVRLEGTNNLKKRKGMASMMKFGKSIGAVLLAGSLIIGGMGLSGVLKGPEKAYAADEVQKNIVNVVGKGELAIKPDIVYLSIGVTTTADTAQEAQKGTAAKIAKLTALFKTTWELRTRIFRARSSMYSLITSIAKRKASRLKAIMPSIR